MSNCRIEAKRNRAMKASKEQKEAYKRLMARDGWKNVTREDAALLSTCQWLTFSQRQAMATIATA